MNFYNPIANIPDDYIESADDYYDSIVNFHLGQAAQAIDKIKGINPVLAKAVADAIMHGLLASNAASHDIFAYSQEERDEDILTRVRKNR